MKHHFNLKELTNYGYLDFHFLKNEPTEYVTSRKINDSIDSNDKLHSFKE